MDCSSTLLDKSSSVHRILRIISLVHEILLKVFFFINLLVLPNLMIIQVIDKSFGFDTAVEEAQRAINVAHIEVESVENGVGIVKLMGRYSGRIHCNACNISKSRCGKRH
ncbi:hypothetical protein ACS0TY_017554 [Phlomoides rotata]